MKYRIDLNISFSSEQDAIDFFNHVESIKRKVYKPSGKENITVFREGRYHKCYHDEDSNVPCGNYTIINFDSEAKLYQLGEI